MSSKLSSKKLKCVTDSYFYTLCLDTERFKRSLLSVTPNESEIPTTTAGGLWGAYLITVAHFCKDLASSELAKLRAIKSVNLSSDLTSTTLRCVTPAHFYT